MHTFQEIVEHAKEIATLHSTAELLSWDQETLMPAAANEHRTNQRVLLSGIIHDKMTAPQYIEALENFSSFANADEKLIITRLLKDVRKATKLPQKFVQEFTRATSEGVDAWSKARNSDNWDLFKPHLAKIVALTQEKASLLGGNHIYDTLLDDYDPETKTVDIQTLFSNLKPKLVALLEEIKQTPFFQTVYTPFATEHRKQLEVCTQLLSGINFDWNCARLDTSEHPFSTGIHPTDARITVRKQSDDLLSQIKAAMHEAGHAMYEMGLPQQHYGTPLCEAISLSIHESQSRFWETIIGQSKAFSGHIFENIKSLPTCPYKNPEQLYTQLNTVACSLNRVEADEVTYPLHIILRFEIEQELLNGTLSPNDVAERWNSGMKELLGITPESNREGCLQDIHWSLGYFGYFPTYTLGSLYSTCWLAAMKKELPLEELISQGNFSPIKQWLHEHVWQHGRRLLSKELVTKSLGTEPTEEHYLSYLREKYVG